MSASPQFPDLPPGWTEEITGFRRIWSAKTPSNKQLTIVHGFGENSNRYRHYPHYLRFQFSKITAVDLPGHGRSPEKRGDCNRFSDFENRVLEVLEPGGNILGHSFGGLVVLKLLMDGKLTQQSSILISAPLLKLAVPAPYFKALAGRWMEPLLPHLQLENEIDPVVISRDPLVVEAYGKDPLNHSKITPRTYVEMTKAMNQVLQWQGPLKAKLGMVLPLGDRLVDAPASLNFYKNLAVENGGSKRLLDFPGFYHEALNDTDKSIVFNALESFYL